MNQRAKQTLKQENNIIPTLQTLQPSPSFITTLNMVHHIRPSVITHTTSIPVTSTNNTGNAVHRSWCNQNSTIPLVLTLYCNLYTCSSNYGLIPIIIIIINVYYYSNANADNCQNKAVVLVCLWLFCVFDYLPSKKIWIVSKPLDLHALTG
jgi:hypothetical protein